MPETATLQLGALLPLRIPLSAQAGRDATAGPSGPDEAHKAAPASPDSAVPGSAARKARTCMHG